MNLRQMNRICSSVVGDNADKVLLAVKVFRHIIFESGLEYSGKIIWLDGCAGVDGSTIVVCMEGSTMVDSLFLKEN
jgi:hypothetical protein